MKKIVVFLVSVLAVFSLVACGSQEKEVLSTAKFEEEVNKGSNMEGSIVEITVDEFVPDSAFGYNIQTGQHLNFVSTSHPDVKQGDVLKVKVESVESMFGSYIVTYKKVK